MILAPRSFSRPRPSLIGFEVVILRDADHQEKLRQLPVGLAEFPKGAAHRVKAGSRHVHRAESTMGGEIHRAEHLGEVAGERLRLVAACEDGKPVRISRPDRGETLGGDSERFLPLDLLEFARATRAHALERLAQASRGQHVHDPGRAFATQHTAVHGVVAIALDIAELAILQMNLDAAAAGAHVARRICSPVADRLRIFDNVFRHDPLATDGLSDEVPNNAATSPNWKKRPRLTTEDASRPVPAFVGQGATRHLGLPHSNCG